MSDLQATLELLHPEGEAFEVRLLRCGRAGTVAGVFDSPARAATEVARYDGRAEGCYVTLNALKPSAQVTNRLRENAPTGSSVADEDIDRRRWLLFDFDPDRVDPKTGGLLFETDPEGRPIMGKDGKPKRVKCPSTEAELAKALARRDQAAGFLAGLGWPAPLKGMSANGGHLLFRLDLPEGDQARDLVEGVLKALAARFGGEGVDVDLTVFNASRITKLYGTLARKGRATADRPYRRAFLEGPAGEVLPVSVDLLKALGGEVRPKPSPREPVKTEGDPWAEAEAGVAGGPGRYDLDRLKEVTDLVALARDLGLQDLKVARSGSKAVARCPAHNDQGRPNLALDQAKGVKCFACGFQANAVGLVMKVKGLTFGEAVRFLAARAGLRPTEIPEGEKTKRGRGLGYVKKAGGGQSYPKGAPLPADSPTVSPSPAAPEVARRSRAVKLVFPAGAKVATIAGHWRRLEDGRIEAEYPDREGFELAMFLAGYPGPAGETQTQAATEGRPAKPLSSRVTIFEALLTLATPITPETPTPGGLWLRDRKGLTFETQAQAGVCWLEDWARADRELKARFGVEALKALGLLADWGDLLFKKHRLLFPFWLTHEGIDRPVYLQARDIEAEGPGRFLRPSKPTPCPYNFNAVMVARATGQPIFIAEGETDTLTLTQSGRLACGIVGTQGFKPEWAKHFAGLSVFLAFDPDPAGRDSARKVAKVFTDQGLPSPRVVKLPEGQDVTDYLTGRKTKKPTNAQGG